MATTEIKITLTNNSTARNTSAVADLLGLRANAVRHNGGKVVIATVASDEVAAVTSRCDELHQVASYEVRA